MGVYQVLRSAGIRAGRAAFVLAVLMAGASAAGAQLRLPRPVGYVNDFADVIPPEHEQRIQQVADEVRSKSGGEIVVVTLPSLEGRNRDEVALQILRDWGIGARGRPGDPVSNTGALVLVVPGERQLKIELGYGTNTFITASEAGRIRDQYMVPAFRQGDFGGGILLAVTAIAQEYAENFDFELTGDVPDLRQARRPRTGGSNFMLFFVLAVILFMILSNRGGRGGGGRGGRRRRGFGGPVIIPFPIGGGFGGGGFGGGGFGGGGFGGGGFGGFGGGSGGGGGAGGGW